MSGFLTKRILITKEATHGVVPTNPVCIELLSESFDFKQDQNSEEINLLGTSGDASPMAFGASNFKGAIGFVASTDNLPVLLTHILGAPTATAAATASTWAATTVYVTGDIVNTVTDTKHSLVCYTGGTSGATEPTLAADPNTDRNARITDGTVVWIAVPKLVQYTFSRQQQMESFTVEYELEDPSANLFYKRFSNVYMNAMPVAMTGGTISWKISGDFVGASATDSTEVGFTELSALAGAKIVPTFKDYYAYEDFTVTIDTVANCGIESINLDITRNVAVEDALNNCKNVNIGITSVKGNMNRVFEIADYTAFKAHTDMAIVFNFTKANGCSAVLTYPLVRPKLADPAQMIDKQAYLSTELSAYGTSSSASVSAVVVAPGLYDSTGALVGTGVY